ncbi:hypothetical protein ACNQR7_32185 [Mycolicibacterium senegalense]|uniref:hypothetical protein n=1 Tax=Mycolicibacterium senegalense TaxID=1796 RepID=UPI003AAF16A0
MATAGLFALAYFGYAACWTIRELGWPHGIAALVFGPIVITSTLLTIVMRRRAGYAAVGVWAIASWTAVSELGWWGFVISVLAVFGARTIVRRWRRSQKPYFSIMATTGPHENSPIIPR